MAERETIILTRDVNIVTIPDGNHGTLNKGDEVITNGGLLGKITDVSETFVTLELADNLQIKLQRQAVANVMPKGTIKSA